MPKEKDNPTEAYGELAEASRETRMMNPKDIFLRSFGFRIHSRPEKGLPVWVRGGVLYDQEKAMEKAHALDKKRKEDSIHE